jgi:hypothetical protein
MFAWIVFTFAKHEAAVERLADEAMNVSAVYFLAGGGAQAFVIEDFSDLIEAVAAGGVELKCTNDVF